MQTVACQNLRMTTLGNGLMHRLVSLAIALSSCSPAFAFSELKPDQAPAPRPGGSAIPTTIPEERSEGPFGIRMGAQVSDYPGCELGKSGYRCRKVPKPHRDADNYFGSGNARDGICSVSAMTPEFRTSVYGNEVMTKVDSWTEQLSSRYGKPSERRNFLREGSIWNEPKDWTRAVLKGERIVMYKIILMPHLEDSGKAYVGVTFRFRNYAQCEQFEKSQKASSF